MHTFDFMMEAGDSGETTIVPGDPDASEFYHRLVESDVDLRMPQEDDPLDDVEIAVLRQWIAQGAPFDGSDKAAPLTSQLAPRKHPTPPDEYHTPIPVMSLCFSPTGDELAVAGYHELLIYNLLNRTLVRRINRLPQRIQSIVWIENTMLIAGGSPGEYGEVAILASDEGSPPRVLGTFSDIALDVAVDSQQSRIASCSADHSTKLWDLNSERLLWTSSIHSSWVTSVAFSGEDRFLATTSLDETIKITEIESGSLYTTYNGHRQQFGNFPGRFKVYDVAFHPGVGRFMSAGEGKAIRIWDPDLAKQEDGTAADMEKRFYEKGHTQYVTHGCNRPVQKIVTSDDLVIVASGDGLVKAFDAENHQFVRHFVGHDDTIYSLAISPDQKRLAAGAYDGKILVWNFEMPDQAIMLYAAP